MKLLKMFTGALAATAVFALSSVVAHAQSTWEAIQDRGTLRIGVTQAPPWFTKDISSGEWTGGLGIALGEQMAAALEVELEAVEVTWGTSIAALQADKIDLMYFLSPTASRARVIDFTTNPITKVDRFLDPDIFWINIASEGCYTFFPGLALITREI